MAIHKIVITAKTSWFIVTLRDDNASWCLVNQMTYTSQGNMGSSNMRIDSKEIMAESGTITDELSDFKIEIYVETDKDILKISLDTAETVTISSDVDSHSAQMPNNVGDFSLSLT